MDELNIANPPNRDQIATETRTFGVAGMTCDNCVKMVEGALRAVPGVRDVRVDRANANATVTFDRKETNVPALHDALLNAGYKPTPWTAG